MEKIIEKPHRLDLAHYQGLVRASFTLCIKNRTPIFTTSKTTHLFVDILKDARKKYFCHNWAYVFMPDHAHIVLEGTRLDSNVRKAIVWFKQKTGYWLSQHMPYVQWQKDFYDHVHKTESELIQHILYVLNNPVRKRLVTSWRDYPFCGSLDNDLTEIIWDHPV